jgi:hypothetical protein
MVLACLFTYLLKECAFPVYKSGSWALFLLFPPFPVAVLFSPHVGDFIADCHATVCHYAVFFSQGWNMHKSGLGGPVGCKEPFGAGILF